MKFLSLILLTFSSLAMAQEQVTLRLNEGGIMKVLRMAVKYNTGSKSSKTIVIPQNIYKFTLKQKDLQSNPFISTVNEISNLNLNKDVDFYLHTSQIKIDGKVDQKSLKVSILKSHNTGFDVKVSITLPQVIVTGATMSLCEDRMKKSKKCGAGLKTTVDSLKISTKTAPVVLSAIMRVSVKKNNARVRVLSVSSNVDTSKGPGLNLLFNNLTVPRLAVVINDQETVLDTSRFKEVILKQRSFLAKKLLGFVGDFIASDVAEMMNIYLANVRIPTGYEILNETNPEKEFEELDFDIPTAMPIDNTYVRPPVYFRSMSVRNEGAPAKAPEASTMEIMQDQVAEIIHNAVASISLKSIKTPLKKDIELGGVLSLTLNDQTINVKNRLGNKEVEALPVLNLNTFRTHDISLALSEPVINGALDLVNNSGLFQEFFEATTKIKGFSVGRVQVHMTPEKQLKLVANVQIDLNKVDSDDFVGMLKTEWAAFRERNNNDSKIYFPLEVVIVPTLVPQPNGELGLSLFIKSPFNGAEIINSYGYPSNVSVMKSEVRKGIIEKLQLKIGPHTNKAYGMDFTKFLNKSSVTFKPKSISFEQGAYLLLNLDIQDIKFSSLNPKKK